MNGSPHAWRRWLKSAVKLAIAAVVLWAVGHTLGESWAELTAHRWRFHFGWLIASAGLYVLGVFPAAVFWFQSLRALGQPVRFWETVRAYYIGHLGKYVPGKAMVLVLRAGLLRGRGVSVSVAAASVFLETLTMMAVGSFMAAAIIAVYYRNQRLLFWGAIAMLLASGLPTVPLVFRFLVRLARVGRHDEEASRRIAALGSGLLALGWLEMAAGWLLMAWSFYAALAAMGVEGLDPVAHLPYYTASVALAVVAGFASLIPGGFLAREAVLTEMAVPYFSLVRFSLDARGAALASAALLRLVWLVAEVAASIILYFAVPRAAGLGDAMAVRRQQQNAAATEEAVP